MNIVEHAERIVTANGLQDVIELVRGKVEEKELPNDKPNVKPYGWCKIPIPNLHINL